MIGNELIAELEKIKQTCHETGMTVATVESCTGGILAMLMTHLPGSSRFFLGGISAYANRVKASVLGVDPDLIVQHGAVSAAVAKSMAVQGRTMIGSTHAIALTGIAGPEGGTPTKPVGTVYCGLASPHGVTSFLWQIPGDREMIRWESARRALTVLAEALEQKT